MVGVVVPGVEMADELIDDTNENGEDEAPLSPRRKLAAGIVMALVVLAAAGLLVRVASPPVRPDQKAPSPHYLEQCGVCHIISESARMIEVEQ
jgi:hypothetical protein